MYGISRIDQPEKKNHGWYVRVTYKGKTEQKFFADKAHGSKPKALKMAQEHRDHLVTLLPPARQEAAARKRSDAAGGLLFTEAEIGEFNEINAELGLPAWDLSKLAEA